jgi:hypothetical protein
MGGAGDEEATQCGVAGHRLDLRGLGKKQGAVLTPHAGAARACGLLQQGESVLWGSLPASAQPSSETVNVLSGTTSLPVK